MHSNDQRSDTTFSKIPVPPTFGFFRPPARLVNLKEVHDFMNTEHLRTRGLVFASNMVTLALALMRLGPSDRIQFLC